jgi:hypothetical protein
MKPFNEYFPLTDFLKLHDHENSPGDIDEAWRKKHATILSDTLLPALRLFLTDYKTEHGLPELQNETGHRTNFGSFWNQFIQPTVNSKKLEDYQIESELDLMISKTLFNATYSHDKDNITPETIQKNYDKFINDITLGNFSRYNLSDCHYCFGCGENFCMEIKQWQPQLIQRTFTDNHKLSYAPATPCPIEPLIELNVNFPTGELLISDWFRIPPFTTAVDDHYKNDVNSSFGRANLTKYHAENFNFIASNSYGMPAILQKGDKLLFGDIDEEVFHCPAAYTNQGRVNSGLRAITIIDKKQLIDIVSVTVGMEEATNMVNDYIKEHHREINHINVTPGDYKFKFSGDCYKLQDELKKEKTPEKIPKNLTPFLIVENTNPALNKTIKIKK